MAKRKTTETFIKQCKERFGDVYNYDKTIYIHSEAPITITCKKHGDFTFKNANDFLRSKGCPYCYQANKYIGKNQPELKRTNLRRKKTQEEFIQECKEKYGDAYDYSLVNYTGAQCKIDIICKKHGKFSKRADNFLFGIGCPLCANKIPTNNEFIEKAKQIHINIDGTPKYDYSETNYSGSENPVIIICPIHGEFLQTPHAHTSLKEGCPSCALENKISNREKELSDFISSIYNGKIKTSDRTILDNFELDIYLPEKQLAFEFDGLYWHSNINRENKYHIQKTTESENKNIQLIHVFEDEWLEKQPIVESRIRQLLGIQKFKISARKCIIKQVPIKDERLFLENNHLQGYIASQICYGLYFTNPDNNKEYLVSLMSFGQLRKNLGSKTEDNTYEMYRFCNLRNFNIQGGASKLFKHFLKQFKPKQIISYADRRWSINNEHNLYHQLGFEFQENTEINYYYIKCNTRINRFLMRKDILVSKYNCPQEMTEQEFCSNILKLRKIYDCGNLKYIWQAK